MEVDSIKILKFIVTRPNDTIEVFLLKNKIDNTYSYVNITKGHICPCRFSSIEAAIQDMDKLIKENKIIKYEHIE